MDIPALSLICILDINCEVGKNKQTKYANQKTNDIFALLETEI